MTTSALKGAILRLSLQEIDIFKSMALHGCTGLQLQVSPSHPGISYSALDAIKFKSGVCTTKDPSVGNVCLNIAESKQQL